MKEREMEVGRLKVERRRAQRWLRSGVLIGVVGAFVVFVAWGITASGRSGHSRPAEGVVKRQGLGWEIDWKGRYKDGVHSGYVTVRKRYRREGWPFTSTVQKFVTVNLDAIASAWTPNEQAEIRELAVRSRDENERPWLTEDERTRLMAADFEDESRLWGGTIGNVLVQGLLSALGAWYLCFMGGALVTIERCTRRIGMVKGRRNRAECTACAYSMTGAPVPTCPECGHVNESAVE